MIKRYLTVSLLVFFTTVINLNASAGGIKPMSELLKEMPDEIVPILTKVNVLDFIDFMDSGSPAEVTNRMKGTSEMLELSESYASIQLTVESRVDLKVLPFGADECLIYVVSSCTVDSLTDSSVKVYDSHWHLASPDFQFTSPNSSSYNKIVLSADSNTLSLYEIYRPLLFEGETRDDRPDSVVEYKYDWDKQKGKFVP